MNPPLFGRDSELEILGRCLSEAHSGKGLAVLISGAPRIGKSSLLDELCVRADAQNFRVLRAHPARKCLPGDDCSWPKVVSNFIASEFENVIGHQWPSAGRTSPWVTDPTKESALPFNRCLEFLLGLKPDDSTCFNSLRQLFEIVSRERPLLLAVDDLDDADEPLLALLQISSQGFYNLRFLLVATYSSPRTSVRPLAQARVEAIRRHARHIALAELEPAATAKLLRQVAGYPCDDATVGLVQDLTGGNPGFVLDTAYACLRHSAPYLSLSVRLGVPSAVRVVIEERLAVLSLEARGLLSIASAIGNTFAPQLLFSLIPLAMKDAVTALSEAEAAGLIRSIGREGYRFGMSFVRKVLYEEFPVTKRTSLHRQIAAALEASHAQNIDANAGDIALHLLASRDTNAIARALELAELGAYHSSQARDYDSAVIMHSIALEALDSSHDTDDSTRGNILMALAEAQKQASDIAGAQESLYQAAEIAQRSEEWPRLADIALAAPTLHWPSPGLPNGLVMILAEKILQCLPERDAARRILVTARWAAELSCQCGERERSGELAARALEMFKHLDGDETSMLQFLRLRDYVLRGPEQASERLRNSLEITRVARRRGDWVALFEGECPRNVSSFQLGSANGKLGLELLEHAALLAGPKYRCLVPAFKAFQAVFNGRFTEGEEYFKSCREMAIACGITDLPDHLWPVMMMPLDEQGRLAELEPAVARCSRGSTLSAPLEALRCQFAAKLGNTAEARFYLERLATDAFADLKSSRGRLVAAAALTEVCAELGDVPHHAASLYELLLPYERYNAVLGITAAFGAVSRYLGKLALSLSHHSEAIRHLQAAIEFNHRIGARAWAAYASFELAIAMITRGQGDDRRAASELLANVHSEAVTMGMQRLASSVRAHVTGIEIVATDFIVERSLFRLDSGYAAANGKVLHAEALTESQVVPSVSLRSQTLTYGELKPASGTSAEQHITHHGIFRLDENYWTVGYAGRAIRLKRLKGLNLIAYLLSRPNQEVHVLELAGIGGLEPDGMPKTNAIDCEMDGSNLGPILDHRAKLAYRERIQELHRDLEEARLFNDLERGARIEDEICVITRELARAVGLAGRDRKMGSQAERARLRVTSAIRWASNKISSQHPALGQFLALSIKTGTFCSYVPHSRESCTWTL